MDPQALFGPVTTRNHRIGDFDSFILNNVPYAQVPPRNVQWGAVQYDGPLVLGIDGGKPALQWHFGGVPYPISKAIRLYYTYIRTWDGSGDIITASIFLGFQQDLTDYVVPQAIPYVANPTQTFKARVNDLGAFGQFSNQVWSSDHAVLGSEANGIVTRACQPGGAGNNAFNDLIQIELGWQVGYGATLFTALTEVPLPVDFDGPAQNSDSHNIFPYTNATLFNDQDKYGQVLFWYFAGKPYRLTKAMRIPLDSATRPQQPGLLAGAPPADQSQSFVLTAARGTAAERTAELLQQAAAEKAAQAAQPSSGANPPPQASGEATFASSPAAAEPPPVDDAPPQGHSLFIGFAGPGFGSGG